MPIRFTCFQCNQLLSVSRRKVGQPIDCPRCGAASVVPEPAAGADREDGPREPDDEPPRRDVGGFDDLDELLDQPGMLPPALATAPPRLTPSAPPAVAQTPAFAPTPPAMLGVRSPAAGPPPPGPAVMAPAAPQLSPIAGPAPAALPPDVANMLLVSRGAVYVQGLLFCLVAGVAFAAGFFFGRGGQPSPVAVEVAQPKPEPVALRGTVQYAVSAGNVLLDHGAIVMALPKEPPLRKLAIQGLRPEDSAGSTYDTAAASVHDAGGDCVRADENGAFHIVVPRPGSYYLLIVSRHAVRPVNERIKPEHVNEISAYFEIVADLIGGQQYRWTLEDFSRPPATLTQTFAAAKR